MHAVKPLFLGIYSFIKSITSILSGASILPKKTVSCFTASKNFNIVVPFIPKYNLQSTKHFLSKFLIPQLRKKLLVNRN